MKHTFVLFFSGCSKISPKVKDKENMDIPIAKTRLSTTLESPDLFKVIDQNVSNENNSNTSSTIIDLSLSDENVPISKTECSPTLNKRKKKFKHKNLNRKFDDSIDLGFKRNIFTPRKSDADESVIAGTPDVSSKPVTSLISSRTTKKSRKKKNTTLTQMYRSAFYNPSKINADDENDSDETRIDESATEGLTDFLDYMNQAAAKPNMDDIQSENEPLDISSCSNDAFSNAIVLNDSDIASPQEIPPKRQKVLPNPVVRGKARKLLPGFSCQECRNFYSNMNLSPEELKRKMDACSRHRYKYNPPPDTMPGYWDLTVTSQEVQENSKTIETK
ncbi:unnamed protein product [Acanthoscelides obtectus]|uniref:DNA endonuclease RBBP8 n=1 Tax=Acanthoscelides obtectus TaxID=200917 RepID=A0A9P0LJU9_ACAOB|nr:unnamed protein product [Acanthoscelides obtectus]CAK1620711.1 DNA endonuclease RBBP8 [Acanthoscelides obtectus]